MYIGLDIGGTNMVAGLTNGAVSYTHLTPWTCILPHFLSTYSLSAPSVSFPPLSAAEGQLEVPAGIHR